jgi:diguanylate cyclase (GGDEF)-like protein
MPRWQVLVLATLGVGGVGIADFLTGSEISFSIFYLLPIAFGAWYARRAAGLVLAGDSCAAWLVADLLSGAETSHLLIPFWNATVRLGFFGLIAVVLSELRLRLDHEETLARTDPLTGVLNGRAFRERAETELIRARRYGHAFALAYVDLDNFKLVNDRHGHENGDRVLVDVVDTVRRELRKTDEIARLGGDELVLLMIETGDREAAAVVDRVRAAVAERMRDADRHVTLSVGLAIFERPPADVAELIRLADELMYSVKRSGKDGVAKGVYPARPPADPADPRPPADPADPRRTRPLRRIAS